jgi:methylmalonyl-CoA mutase
MELGYQRAKIQEESLYYEMKKHDGSLPIIGVNTFRNPQGVEAAATIALARSTEAEKQSQVSRVRQFQARHHADAGAALARLKQVAIANGNLFDELMNTVRVASLGQITQALFEVGGQYRRNM